MSEPLRVLFGGRVDRARPIHFSFDGRQFEGFPGDTLASALLAHGIHFVGRSFKYHRPRGFLAAGSEEPNALVTIDRGGGRWTPNLRATQVELYDGLVARSQNSWPSLFWDIGALNGLAAPMLGAGFYYKTFMGPRFIKGAKLWHDLFEPAIRRAAGLGEPTTEPDPDGYANRFAHCDVLVIGGGPAGLAAAFSAAATGQRVILCDENSTFGGSLLDEGAATIDGLPAADWAVQATRELAGYSNVTLLPRTQAFGYYNHNLVGLNQRLTDHLARPGARSARERLWQVRAGHVVLAVGAIERPLVFPDNDRPGIMLAGAARSFLHRYGVRAGTRAVVLTAHDSAYRVALDLQMAGTAIARIVDLREHPDGPLVAQARTAGIPVMTGATVVGTDGRHRVHSVRVGQVAGPYVTDLETIACDLVLMCGGWTPSVHLFSQSRGKLSYDELTTSFLPGMPAQAQTSVGACAGSFGLARALADGHRVGHTATLPHFQQSSQSHPPAASPPPPGGEGARRADEGSARSAFGADPSSVSSLRPDPPSPPRGEGNAPSPELTGDAARHAAPQHPPHAEEPPEAATRSTHNGSASFDSSAPRPAQDEGRGARAYTVTGDDAFAGGGIIGALPTDRDPTTVKAFVDFQNDVTAKDIGLAVREGFHSIEHIKRYTTTGMATDQGKTSNMNALGIASKALGRDLPAVGLTTFRQPYTPVTFGAFAGLAREQLFDPSRETPIHGWAAAHGAVFEDVSLWKRAWYFPRPGEDMHAAVNRECQAVRERAGLFDASTLGKIEVVGPDAAEFLNRMYVNSWTKLGVGKCRYGLMLNESGFIMDDGVVGRLAPDRFHVTTTTGGAPRVMAHMEDFIQTEFPDLEVWLTSTTEQWAVIAVQGPRARDILAPFVDGLDISAAALPHMAIVTGTFRGVPMRLFRVSFTGEAGFEVNVPADYGRAAWEMLWAEGRKYDAVAYGTETMHVLRAEKGYIIVGQDTDGTVTPDDAGLGGMVGKQKADFVGQRSLRREDLARPCRKQIVGLLTEAPATVLEEGAQITHEGSPKPGTHAVGHVTSSYWSAVLGRSVAMAVVENGRALEGVTVHIPMPNGSIAAKIVKPVFVDPEGARLHG